MIKPNRWLRAQIQMDERSRQANSRKAAPARRRIELRPVMPRQSEINSDVFVLGLRRAAHLGIPLRAPVGRPDDERPPYPVSQGLQMIQKKRRVPILAAAIPAAALTGQLCNVKVLPAPRIRQGAACLCHRQI